MHMHAEITRHISENTVSAYDTWGTNNNQSMSCDASDIS